MCGNGTPGRWQTSPIAWYQGGEERGWKATFSSFPRAAQMSEAMDEERRGETEEMAGSRGHDDGSDRLSVLASSLRVAAEREKEGRVCIEGGPDMAQRIGESGSGKLKARESLESVMALHSRAPLRWCLPDSVEKYLSEKEEESVKRYNCLREEQEVLEANCYEEARQRYKEMLEGAREGGRVAALSSVQQQLMNWTLRLDKLLDEEQGKVWKGVRRGKDRMHYGPLLILLSSDKLAVIVVHEVVNLCMRLGNKGVPASVVVTSVSDAIQAEVNFLRLKQKFGKEVTRQLQGSGRNVVRMINLRARRALEGLDSANWTVKQRCKLGAVLVRMLMDVADDPETGKPAFIHELQWAGKKDVIQRKGMLLMDPDMFGKLMLHGDTHRMAIPRYKPMVIPPRPWVDQRNGAYLYLKTSIMRTRGSNLQKRALDKARDRMNSVYDGLNCVARVPWKINEPVLDVIQEALRRKLTVGDLPSQERKELPECENYEPLSPEEKRTFRWNVRQTKRRNANNHSIYCDLKIKLAIAEEFRKKDEIFFPHSLDFRGRAYPVPPNFNHMGGDASRAMLKFSKEFPLGERGWYWLRVHCANVFGKDKLSFDERVEFIDEKMDEVGDICLLTYSEEEKSASSPIMSSFCLIINHIIIYSVQVLDSAREPLSGRMWWAKAEEPWQCLATCMEIAKAVADGDPRNFESSFPVHQDGSCNGLQHYAALSRDMTGGESVNLTNGPRPRDVYTGASSRVSEMVRQRAANPPPADAPESEQLDYQSAVLLDGVVDRKLVKQTVMTSVYGVTFVGARKQIQGRLVDKFRDRYPDMPEEELEKKSYQCAFYAAKLTMAAIDDLFTEAR